MKKIVFTFFISQAIFFTAFAQNAGNVGIGTSRPVTSLQVAGNFLVAQSTVSTNSQPTAAQTKTMLNGVTSEFTTDSTGRIYDPGGPVGNYLANLNSTVAIYASYCIGIQITIEDILLAAGDSLIITDYFNTSVRYLAVGNGYTFIDSYIFNSPSISVTFKSNSDAFVGKGFSILFKRLYANPNITPAPENKGYAGNALLFDPVKGSLNAGALSQVPIGYYSLAIGNNTIASAFYSTAIGYNTTASGNGSTAMGHNTVASGSISTSIGENTLASGGASLATGQETIASGNQSTAMGYNVSTNGKSGSFIIGDYNTSRIQFFNDVNNQMQMVFGGGYRLYTGTNSAGVYMNGGDNSWSSISDSTKKENVTTVNGEGFLQKISVMKLGSWNYKGQDAKRFRHYGPMAQDFHNAFGKDAFGNVGCDTLINQSDFLGVNFIAIQALEKRTQKIEQQQKEIIALQNKNMALAANNEKLELQLMALMNAVNTLNKQVEQLVANNNNTKKSGQSIVVVKK